jgi:glycosyltransferase involved in cell wall biosynthesis
MSFANQYIAKNGDCKFAEVPNLPQNTSMVVVIPCLNEPNIKTTLFSLFENHLPENNFAIVVVVNDAEDSIIEIKEQNRLTYNELESVRLLAPDWITLLLVYAENLPTKWAGAGWARKIGMDLAIAHFNRYNIEEGILISLDADAVVEPNYLLAIKTYFQNQRTKVAATLYFEHPIDGQMNEKHREAIVLYELYLRYYKLALSLSRFPVAIYTIGSCFAVKAKAYIAQGGMNRRKAGEDFYFLHKIAQYGEIGEVNHTTVYPSSRISNRVPFGTGPALANHLNGQSDLNLAYRLEAFLDLKTSFSNVELLYHKGGQPHLNNLSICDSLKVFLSQTGLLAQIDELAANCSNETIFRKRFFHLFDALQVLKWLNFTSTQNYPKGNLLDEAQKLLQLVSPDDANFKFDQQQMLIKLRSIEKV